MIKPSLSRNLLVIFSTFVVIESLLIGILCYDVMAMNDAARRELEAVQLSHDIYTTMNQFTLALDAMAELRNNPESPECARNVKLRRQEFNAGFKAQSDKLQSSGFDPMAFEKLQDSIGKVFDLWEVHVADKAKKKRVKKERVGNLAKCLSQFAVQLEYVQKLSTKIDKPLLGILPANLLHITAAINILYLILAVAFVERSISRPLARLTEDCESIRKRQALAKSAVQPSEIGTLQESFQQMSKQVVENENRRKSYLVLLQSVQLKSLSNAKDLLQVLSQSASLMEKAKSRLAKTLSNLGSLAGLLRSMTEQLEGNADKMISVNRVSCKSRQLLQETADSLDALLQSRNIKLEFDGVGDHKFSADADLISRVILNLVSNAVKYSADRGTVRVCAELDGERLKFSVQDNGPGIAADGLARLFKRFSQVEAADGSRRAGTGLGLVICKELVEAHGGEIGCVSNPGEGSMFWFAVPIVEANKNTGGAELYSSISSSAGELWREPEPALERGKLKSIKTELALLLLVFIVTQSYLLIELNGLFADSAARNKAYQTQKKHLLSMEEFFIAFVRWSNRMQLAQLRMEMSVLKNLYPRLIAEKEKLEDFKEEFDKNSASYAAMSEIVQEETALLALMKEATADLDALMANISQVKEQGEVYVEKIELAWKALMAEQHGGFKASYQFSEQVRSKILLLLVMASLADLLLIGSAAFLGLKLAGKILVLKSKAESFGAGQRIAYSLKGNDELSFLDQRLCQVAGEIRDAEDKRQELLAVINHDLRTPLTSIVGTMENLRQGAFGAIAQDDLKKADQAMHELENLLLQINNLLLLEKIESRTYETNIQNFELDELIDKVAEELSFSAKRKGLSVQRDGSLPVRIQTDRELLFRALSALLKNAIEASFAGGEIVISLRNDTQVVVQISNSGAPFDPNLLPQIFERFRFVDGKPVSGLGLPLAFQCLRLLGGSLSLHSEAGYTVAKITLPVSRSGRGSDALPLPLA